MAKPLPGYSDCLHGVVCISLSPKDTRKFVMQMANGGVEPPDFMKLESQHHSDLEAMEICIVAHKEIKNVSSRLK